MILNENYSRAISSSRFSLNKKKHTKNPIYIFYVSQAFIGNVANNIYGGKDALV